MRGIVTVCSGKGGVGKTTTAAALAGALHLQGGAPVLLDCDYGASLTRAYGYDPDTCVVEHLLDGQIPWDQAVHETSEGIPLVPAASSLARVPAERMEPWRRELRKIGRDRLLVIDTSDDIFSAPVAAAILAADILVIPVPLSRKAYDRTFPEIGGLLDAHGHEPELIWFGAMVDKRAALPKVMLQIIAEDGIELACMIPRAIAADEADFEQRSVVAAKPKSKIAQAYQDLARTVYARLRRLNGASAVAARKLSTVNG